jgi:hypothetical protein
MEAGGSANIHKVKVLTVKQSFYVRINPHFRKQVLGQLGLFRKRIEDCINPKMVGFLP